VSEPVGTAHRSAFQRSLRATISALDVHLRRAQGVFEYSAADDCIFRLTLAGAEATVRLRGGVVIERGEPVVSLHFWNEHLPAMPDEGPNFAWANLFRHRMNSSLVELSACLDTDPRLRGVKAVRGRLASAIRGQRETARRFSAHFGFETIPAADPPPLAQRLHDSLDNLWMLILVWAFNPPALEHRTVILRREEVWMSKAVLDARYQARPDTREMKRSVPLRRSAP
jgi:hypothetical protein